MLRKPRRPWDLTVGDVRDQQVQEGVLALAFDRGPTLTANELLPREGVEHVLDSGPVASIHPGERARPEDLAHDRRVLEQGLLLRIETVQAGGDDALDRLGYR